VRYQLLPVVIFVGAAVVTGWLWGRFTGMPSSVGEVYPVRADVSSPIDGILITEGEKPVDLFDEVIAGQVLARVSDPSALSTLARMQGDLVRLRVDLAFAAADILDRQASLQQNDSREVRSLSVDLERLRLSQVEFQGLIETDKVELARLEEKVAVFKPLVERGVESKLALADMERQRDVVRQHLEATRKSLAEAEAQRAAREERLRKYSTAETDQIAALLVPVREAIAQEELRLQDIRRRLETHDIKAPITGTVTSIFVRPGQSVTAGLPILTIAASQGSYILSYVRQEQMMRPAVGQDVKVVVRTLPRATGLARVERIGPQVEPVPPHQLRDPKVLEWGLPVRITIPADLNVKPGELVDVAFRPSAGGATP